MNLQYFISQKTPFLLPTRASVSNPMPWPLFLSRCFFLAYLLFPSIINATCLGIGPHFTASTITRWYHGSCCLSFNQDMLWLKWKTVKFVMLQYSVQPWQVLPSWECQLWLQPTSRLFQNWGPAWWYNVHVTLKKITDNSNMSKHLHHCSPCSPHTSEAHSAVIKPYIYRGTHGCIK